MTRSTPLTRPRLVLADRRRVPRSLHPLAWWVWALGLAAAASRTSNPLLLGLLIGVLGVVIANRRTAAPWARAFRYYLILALVVIGIRVVFRSVFGGDIDADTMHVWFRLPRVPLPSWASGVQIGGPVTAEGTASALYDGLLLAALLCCVGAANTLADPKRALRVLPGALYELGAAVVVSLSVAPQLVESAQRIRRARKLRGRARIGVHGLREVAIPVLEDAFARSLHLAAAMDSRGYGRTGTASRRSRRLTGALLIGGVGGLCIGIYGLLDPTVPELFGPPTLAIGVMLCIAGLALGGRRVRRSRYRPDPWATPEWLVAAAGVIPAIVTFAGVGFPAASVHPSTHPLVWPSLPLVPAAAILAAALAAVAAPPPPGRPRVGSATPGRGTTTVAEQRDDRPAVPA